MNFSRSFFKFFKKLFLASVIFLGIGLGLVIFVAYGMKLVPCSARELVEHFRHRSINDFKRTYAKSELLATYLKLCAKPYFSSQAEINHENLVGLDVAFYNYSDTRQVFSEVFIEECYNFNADRNDPFIIDCGGNIGMATLYFKKLYPNANVIVFEPEPHSFAILQKNIESNGIKDVVAVNKAVSNVMGECLFEEKSKSSIGAHLLIGQKGQSSKDSFVLSSDLLSKYIDRPVDFLKLDVEGSEGLVFEDLVCNDKLKFIKEIVMEFHPYLCNMTLGKILSTLDSQGFSYKFPSASSLMIHAYNKNFQK